MPTETLTLTDFLLARIAEDEEQANRSLADNAMNPDLRIPNSWVEGVAARVLADVEAKRRIVEEVLSNPLGKSGFDEVSPWALKMLGLLALPFADHPDYREEWKP